MNNLEAIKMLKDWNIDLSLTEDENEGIECHNIVIQALKKQIPQKPQCTGDGEFAVCVCGNSLENEWKFCPNCGQSIDWNED